MKYKNIYSDINRMACPILLNYLLMSIFELLDKVIVGHYSVQGFAVVGVAASSIYAITGALGIISSAFHIVAADAKGKKDEQGFQTAFVVSRNLVCIIGMCFFVLCILGGRCFFQRVYGIQGNDLSELLSYFYPAAFTIVQNMLIFQYSAYFRNCLNTKIALYSTIVSTGVNLFFDFSLVYGFFGLPGLGVAGTAWGSVIGLFAGLLVYQFTYYKKHSLFYDNNQMKCFTERLSVAKHILGLYPSLFGQELLESTIFVFVISGVVARLGTEQMAVYNLLETVGSTIGLPVYAYATAAQTFALQNYSAGEYDAVKRYLKGGIRLSFAVIISLCILCGIFSREVLYLIVTNADIVAVSRKLLGWVFLLQLIKIPYQIYMSYLQGVGKEKFVFVCTAVGTVGASVGIVVLGNLLGLSGFYLIMILEFLILGCIYVSRKNISASGV